jgi:hypothetical protein
MQYTLLGVIMPITIIAGGCRVTSDEGKIGTSHCDFCPQQGNCDMEPRARELEELVSDQWVNSSLELPPEKKPILFLEHSSKAPLDTIRYGQYEHHKKKYTESSSGRTLPEEAIIAWMPIPRVPGRIYRKH